MLAVIKTGGKQYLVSPGQKIKIEKIGKKEGSEITFKEVCYWKKTKKRKLGSRLLKEQRLLEK